MQKHMPAKVQPSKAEAAESTVYPAPTPQEALAIGWSVVPCGPDKKALVAWKKYQSRLPSREEVAAWEQSLRPPCWAVVTGPISNRFTLDFDGPAGIETMRSLGIAPHRKTPSGGYHADFLLFDEPLKTINAKSARAFGRRFPAMDVRGPGGYVIFRGQTKKGKYEWLKDPRAPLERIGSLLRKMLAEEDSASNKPNGQNHVLPCQGQRVDAGRLIEMALGRLLHDGRNNTGFWLAIQLRDNDFSQSEALDIMQDYAARCPATNTKGSDEPYSDSEIRTTVAQAYSCPAREPWVTEGVPATEQVFRFNWPAPLEPEAFHGLAGEVVRLIEPHSEADPAALLVQVSTGFGSIVGRHAHFNTDGARQFANLYTVIVGVTAKGRKGTSQNQSRRILRQVDQEWSQTRVVTGLASGEGLIWAVRDPITERSSIKEKGRIVGYEDNESDPGVADKRLLVVEPEFSRALRVMERESNTLSAILREGFDSGDLNTLTKNKPAKATGAHISLIGHVTREELRRELTDTSAANGFANRILWVCARRSKLLPDGGDLDSVDFSQIIERLQAAANFARSVGEMHRDEEARAIWHAVYESLSEGRPGMFGAITSRADCLGVRLSMIYALLDQSPVIKAAHLKAALAVWRYCEDSARFIFGDSLGEPVADEILRDLRGRSGGMTRTEIRDLFQRNKPSEEVSRALGALQEHGLARVTFDYEQEDQRRPTERWYAITVQPLTEVRH
jgi:hypothetical protein